MLELNFKISFLLLVCFTSCSDKYDYWDISQFEINNKALKNNSEVKITYTSRGIEQYKAHDEVAYRHFIVISTLTNDTVNVLTTSTSVFTKNDFNKNYTFYKLDSKENLEIESIISEFKDTIVNDIENKNVFNNQVKLTKVYRDPSFDHIANNNFPAIFGNLFLVERKNI